MAKFPINRATGSLPGVSGSAPVKYNTDTGAGQIGQAVQNIGQTAFNVNSIVYRKQGEAELTKVMSEANDEVSKMFLDMETNQDETTYDGIWNKTFDRIKQREPKNGWAREQYRKAMFSVKDKIGGAVQQQYVNKVDEKYKWAVARDEAEASQSGNIDLLRQQHAARVSRGTMTKEEMDFRLEKIQPVVDTRAKELREEAAYNSLYAIYTSRLGGADLAQKQADTMVNEGVIGREEAQRVLRQIKADDNTRKDQEKQAEAEAQYEATRKTLVGILNKGITDPQQITDLLDSDAITITQAKSLQSAMVPPDVSDPAALAAINDKMLEYALRDITKKEALDAIIKASPKLRVTATEALVNDLTTTPNQTTAKALTDANTSIKNIIGSVSDMFGNIVVGSDFEQVAIDDAKLFLEREVREAALAKKPMTREDIRIRAIELAYQAKLTIPEDPRNMKPEMRYKKRMSYDRLYESMSDKYKAAADKLKADGKTEKEILELFYAK